MSTYSFIDVQATLTGPGGVVPLGYGAGTAEEGIDTDMVEDKNTLTIGADGTPMHSLHASDAGRVTIRLLKTSPANKALNLLYNLQKSDSSLWGQNVLVISDTARGDVLTGTQLAFNRQTPVKYGKEGGTNEWSFVGVIQEILGSGQPQVGA
jgi:predicted SPOUT superfamily RNA methylase MTH1